MLIAGLVTSSTACIEFLTRLIITCSSSFSSAVIVKSAGDDISKSIPLSFISSAKSVLIFSRNVSIEKSEIVGVDSWVRFL